MFNFDSNSLDPNQCYDFIINILFIITIILLMMYILRYYCNLHFVIKLNKKENFKDNIKMEEGDIIT